MCTCEYMLRVSLNTIMHKKLCLPYHPALVETVHSRLVAKINLQAMVVRTDRLHFWVVDLFMCTEDNG